MNPARPLPLRLRHAALPLLLSLGLAGCASINERLQGDKIDYKTSGTKTVTLEVPPDLTQLTRDSRYQPVGGAISASALQAAPQPGAAASAPVTVAPSKVGDVTLERAGTQRWLATAQTPEQLWPQLQAFWQERGFALELEQRETGLMETNWAENRANVPQDFIRSTIGKVFDSVWDSGLRDLYRTRLERGADGRTEIYISHRGMEEVYTSERKESTIWQPRPADPELEAVMLSRLMLKLGSQQEQATAVEKTAATPSPAPGTARARLLGPAGAGLQVDDGFDRAWRRVGLALDRNGFTVEDRDRSQGQYFVRYVDPAQASKGEPGFFAKLFGSDKDKLVAGTPARYRIALQSQAETTVVKVLNGQGAPETGDAAQRILEMLATELR
ncbi:MAG TPA: outer membrane protein assembly factor BamC [Methylibium sp.]|nr:outer membrane protein assembly factor BamC [Methylibium sp.]